MGCCESAQEVIKDVSGVAQDEALHLGCEAKPDLAQMSLAQLGVEVPVIPGDVGLCGDLTDEVLASLAPRYASWVCLALPEGQLEAPEALRRAVKQQAVVKPFPGPRPPPSEEQVAAALEALDTLPRPLMLQCNTGNKAGALLLLWLVMGRGYSLEVAKQFAQDMDLHFWARCTRCGPMREWLLSRLPESDVGRAMQPAAGLVLSQLLDPASATYTYVLGCQDTKEAVLVDPVLEQKERDLTVLRELGLNLRCVVNTHVHDDHITSGGTLRREIPEVHTVISKASGAMADVLVDAGDQVTFGCFALEAIATPGHTKGCVTWLLRGSPRSMAFTGDALWIRGCGRTDQQDGNAEALYESVHAKIFSLERDTLVYPGHDAEGRNVSTIEEEIRFNPRLKLSQEAFMEVMAKPQAAPSVSCDEVVKLNMADGFLG